MRQTAGREKDPYDGTNGCYRESDGEGTNHPLAMRGKAALPREKERTREGDEKNDPKQCCRSGLDSAANAHFETHQQSRDADNCRQRHENPADPAVQPPMTGSYASNKL